MLTKIMRFLSAYYMTIHRAGRMPPLGHLQQARGQRLLSGISERNRFCASVVDSRQRCRFPTTKLDSSASF